MCHGPLALFGSCCQTANLGPSSAHVACRSHNLHIQCTFLLGYTFRQVTITALLYTLYVVARQDQVVVGECNSTHLLSKVTGSGLKNHESRFIADFDLGHTYIHTAGLQRAALRPVMYACCSRNTRSMHVLGLS